MYILSIGPPNKKYDKKTFRPRLIGPGSQVEQYCWLPLRILWACMEFTRNG